jgi:hypothetical protein
MARKQGSVTSSGDIVATLAGTLLALTSATFATYVIFIAPQARIDPQQLAPTQILASANQELSDPITTGSIDPIVNGQNEKRSSFSTRSELTGLAHYKIRAFTNEMAIIDFEKSNLTYSAVIKVGDKVPGFGRILSIVNRNGNWFLVTDQGNVADEGFTKIN